MASSMDDLPLILGFTVVAFVLGAATPVIVHRLEPTPPPPRCAIRPARVRHVFRRHAEIKQAMGFRPFIFRGVTKVRDEWDLPCAALNLRRLRALGVAAA